MASSLRLVRSISGVLALLFAASLHGHGLEPAADWAPLQVEVKDETGKAFDRFSYSYVIINQLGDFSSAKDLQSEDGSIHLKAPAQCDIQFSIKHPEVDIARYRSAGKAERNHGEAKVTGSIPRGIRIRGRVIAEADGKPVAGALVMPLKLMIPLYLADPERVQVTDVEGMFELPGVSMNARLSFKVEHPDFAENAVALSDEEFGKPVEVKLKVGETVHGLVRGPDGKPLAGVEVGDGSSRKTLSGDDGTFALHCLRKEPDRDWHLFGEKEGYATAKYIEAGIPDAGVDFRLERLPDLRGQVTLPDGSPATEFVVCCEAEDSNGSYYRAEMQVKDAGGNFSIRPKEIAKTGKYWLGVRAAGAAPWDEVVAAGSGAEKRIVLSRGRKLTARLAAPAKAEGPFDVLLESADSEDGYDGPSQLLKVETRIQRGEPLLINHLRPGNYLLKIRGKNATPLALPVAIADDDLDVGELHLAGTGVIFGKLAKSSKDDTFPRFARGFIRVAGVDEDNRTATEFRTDAEGNFRVEAAPTGKLSIQFPMLTGCTSMNVSGPVELGEGEEREVKVGLFGLVQ